MAAAAAVILGIALTTLLLNKKQPLPESQTAAISPIVQQPLLQANDDTVPSTNSFTAAQQTTAKSNITLHKKNKPTTIIDIDTNYNKTLLLANTTEIELSNPTDKLFTKLTNTNGEQTNDIAMLNTPNSYINITGPNGDQIKVSAKFSKMINLLKERDTTKTEYLDKIIKEGAVWKIKFKTWREKMNNSNITPTPANFMNIIELSKILKENK
jgi:neutral trehalase